MWNNITPRFETPAGDIEACRAAYLKRIAATPAPEKPGANSNAFYDTYARLALGYPLTEGDEKIIDAACVDALEHHDCSDFRLCYMLKALRQGLPIPKESAEKIHKASIDYSFWGVMVPVLVWLGKNKGQKLLLEAAGLVLIAGNVNNIQTLALCSLPILALYNGQRGKWKLKYFFYLYFPAHIVALEIIAYFTK